MTHAESQQQLLTGIAALVAAVFLVRRTIRPQTIRVYALVAAPVLLFIVACLVIATTPPLTVLGFAVVAGGVLAGAVFGFLRARHSRVELGPQPGTIVVAGNGILVAVLLAAFAVRTIARTAFGTHGPLGLAVTDAFLLFAVASVGVSRGMLYVHWRKLSRTGRSTATGTS